MSFSPAQNGMTEADASDAAGPDVAGSEGVGPGAAGGLGDAAGQAGAEGDAPPRPVSKAAAAARARDAAIEGSILRLVGERGDDRSICPSEAARAVAAAEGRAEWHTLMGNVRRIAVRLRAEGRVEILRKGRPVEGDVRGVIRLRQARAGGAPEAAGGGGESGAGDGEARIGGGTDGAPDGAGAA